jgi:hypothetical protein
MELHRPVYTPLAVVSRARKTLRISTTATVAQIPEVSSKDVFLEVFEWIFV